MNKEEIEELKDFTIDLTDIDELALGLEVCSKKSNMVIQEFADTIIQLQEENKQLKAINKEYERLNKENGRGFKITNVQEYNIDELLSYKKYKDNWNKLKEYLNYKSERAVGEDEYVYDEIYNEMQEIIGDKE